MKCNVLACDHLSPASYTFTHYYCPSHSGGSQTLWLFIAIAVLAIIIPIAIILSPILVPYVVWHDYYRR